MILFNFSTFDTPQTMQIQAIDNTDVEGDVRCVVQFEVKTQDVYFQNITNSEFMVTLVDDDVAGIVISNGSMQSLQQDNSQLMMYGGSTAFFDISLQSQPLADVSILFTSSDNHVNVTSAVLFTSSTWNITQHVIVYAMTADTAQWHSITVAVNTTDRMYAALTSRELLILVTDADASDVIQVTAASSNTTDRGGQSRLFIVLMKNIPGPIHITVQCSREDIVTWEPHILSFTPSMLHSVQSVDITGIVDHIITRNISYQIEFSVTGSGIVEHVNMQLTQVDMDYAALNCSTHNLTVNEAGTYLWTAVSLLCEMIL